MLFRQRRTTPHFDVREPWEFQICHIAGSRLVPLREIGQQIGTLDLSQETVLVCHHGVRSRQVNAINLSFVIPATAGIHARQSSGFLTPQE